MKASELIEQLKNVGDDVDLAVRFDLSDPLDPSTEDHRAEASDLVEVMKIRDVSDRGRVVTDACILMAPGADEWGGPWKLRAEKAEAELAALKITDARRTVALAGAEDWARVASRRMGIDFPGVGLALQDYSVAIVAAARKRLGETDERR